MRTAEVVRRPVVWHLAGCLALTVAGCSGDTVRPTAADAASATQARSASGAQGAAASRSANVATKGHPVPVHGEFVGRSTSTRIAAADNLFRIDVVATGNVSHFGRSQATWALPEVIFDPVNQRLIAVTSTWIGAITAANGDQVFGEFTLRSPSVSFSAVGTFQAVTDLVVTGGTGRFADASGTGVGFVEGNIFTERFASTLTGLVRY